VIAFVIFCQSFVQAGRIIDKRHSDLRYCKSNIHTTKRIIGVYNNDYSRGRTGGLNGVPFERNRSIGNGALVGYFRYGPQSQHTDAVVVLVADKYLSSPPGGRHDDAGWFVQLSGDGRQVIPVIALTSISG